jgi:hypothetical protein
MFKGNNSVHTRSTKDEPVAWETMSTRFYKHPINKETKMEKITFPIIPPCRNPDVKSGITYIKLPPSTLPYLGYT